MSRLRVLTVLAVAVALGACSDSQTPSGPSEAGSDFTFQLDQSSGPALAVDESMDEAGGVEMGLAGLGKNAPDPDVVSCVNNANHQFCVNIRNGRLRAADADAFATNSVNRTRGQIRLNGFLIYFTNRFGPVFRGDHIFARYRELNTRLFRGDRLCHQFPGAVNQVCGIVT